jgi:hypothetical protein
VRPSDAHSLTHGRRIGAGHAILTVAVEKLDIHKNGTILGDDKWSVASYKSLVGHPEAM